MTAPRELRALSCDEAEELSLDRASADLRAEDAEALDQHLTGCEACRTFAVEIGDLESGLEDLFGAVARGDLAGAPEAGFVAALPGLRRRPLAPAHTLRWIAPLGGLAAAAALLLAFGPSLGVLGGVETPSPAEVSATSPSPSTLAVITADAKLELALADILPGF